MSATATAAFRETNPSCRRRRAPECAAACIGILFLGFAVHSPARAVALRAVAGTTASAVAVGDGVIWWASTIHQAWYPATGIDSTLSYLACVRASSFYVATGENGSIWASTDGEGRAFQRRARPATVALRGLAVAGSRLVVVGDGGAIHLSGDLNAASWTPEISPVGANLRAVAWNGTSTVAVGDGGTVIRAGSTSVGWQQVQIGETADLLAVSADPPPGAPGRYLVAGRGGVLWGGEADGLTWTKLPSPTTRDLRGATWIGPDAVVVGAGGTIYWSPGDVSSWQQVVSPVTEDLSGVRFTGVSVLAVGENGAVLNSLRGLEWRNTITPVPVEEESWGRIKARWGP